MLIDEVEHPVQDLDPKTMRNYGRMKNQFTVSINQPLRFGKDDYGSFYTSGSWSDYWGAGRAAVIIQSATVTALHGEATVSAPNAPGMNTAKQKTAFTSVFQYLSKSCWVRNIVTQVSRALIHNLVPIWTVLIS